MFKSLKRVVVAAVMVVLLVSSVAVAAPDAIVKVDPLGLLSGVYGAKYEMVRTENSSIQFSGFFSGSKIGSVRLAAISAGAELRFYVKEPAPNGLYYGPAASITMVSGSEGEYSASSIVLGAGGVGGYQYIMDNGLVLDGSIGIIASFGSMSVGDTTVSLGGIGPSLVFGIGYVWVRGNWPQ